MNEINTTSSDNCEDWVWFQEYKKHVSLRKKAGVPKNITKYEGPVPVELGIEYAKWAMSTPEVRDLIYRRFVMEDYNNIREGNLLDYSVIYFEYEKNASGINSRVANTWHLIGEMMKGEMKPVESAEFRERLLSMHWDFRE